MNNSIFMCFFITFCPHKFLVKERINIVCVEAREQKKAERIKLIVVFTSI